MSAFPTFPPATREQIRAIAADAGWMLTVASNMDVFTVDAPDIPQPPVAILWENGTQYQPTPFGAWHEEPLSEHQACFVFDMALARESLDGKAKLIPGVG